MAGVCSGVVADAESGRSPGASFGAVACGAARVSSRGPTHGCHRCRGSSRPHRTPPADPSGRCRSPRSRSGRSRRALPVAGHGPRRWGIGCRRWGVRRRRRRVIGGRRIIRRWRIVIGIGRRAEPYPGQAEADPDAGRRGACGSEAADQSGDKRSRADRATQELRKGADHGWQHASGLYPNYVEPSHWRTGRGAPITPLSPGTAVHTAVHRETRMLPPDAWLAP